MTAARPLLPALLATLALVPAASAQTPIQTGTGELCRGLSPTLVGTAGDDVLTGTAGDDVIAGLGGADRIRAGAGNDVVCGGAGFDTLAGGAGDDVLDGGADGDAADFVAAPNGVTADLAVAGPQDTGEGADTFVSLTDLYGSAYGDVLAGRDDNGASVEFLMGGAGDDVLSGRGGRDRLDGNWDDDTIDAGEGADQLNGQDGADTITSRDASADTVTCGAAADVLDADGADLVAADCEAPAAVAPVGGDGPGPLPGGELGAGDAGPGGPGFGGPGFGGLGEGPGVGGEGDVGTVDPLLPVPDPGAGPSGSRVTVPAQRLRSVLGRGLLIEHACASLCRATWTVSVDRRTARRLGLAGRGRGPVRVARATSLADAGDEAVALARLSAPARRRLQGVRSVSLVVTGSFAAQDGSVSETVVTVRVGR